MDKIDFVEGIKILSSCYQKVISNDDISIWYEILQDIEPEVFKKAIIELCKERTYMPTIHDILDKTKVVKNNYYLSILEKMKKDWRGNSESCQDAYGEVIIMNCRKRKLPDVMKRYEISEEIIYTNLAERLQTVMMRLQWKISI